MSNGRPFTVGGPLLCGRVGPTPVKPRWASRLHADAATAQRSRPSDRLVDLFEYVGRSLTRAHACLTSHRRIEVEPECSTHQPSRLVRRCDAARGGFR